MLTNTFPCCDRGTAAAKVVFNFESDRASFQFSALSSDSNVTGKITLRTGVFNSDIQVCISGKPSVIIQRGQTQEFTFPISSTIIVRPRILADIDVDCNIDFEDFTFLADRWLSSCDIGNDFCDGSDIDQSGGVDLEDVSELTQMWLQ